ncbi:hypothetical protein KKI24_12590 [bacterium]|nr:hypothetical protein [bacterium]
MAYSACHFKGCELIVVENANSPVTFFFAQVIINERIRIFGCLEGYMFDKYFSVMDSAIFDHLILSASGTITEINEKTITVSVDQRRCKTISISEFIRMNAFLTA